jgi:hypothetical protein
MGKRSTFERVERDFYTTPKSAVAPLLPFLGDYMSYCEPCAGAGDLLRRIPLPCASAYDIAPQSPHVELMDAMSLGLEDLRGADCIITNPPWRRDVLHPLISRFSALCDTWLLFDADWMHTRQASPYITRCHMIVSVGRVKWVPDSKFTGKDNCCWYLFRPQKGRAEFFLRVTP